MDGYDPWDTCVPIINNFALRLAKEFGDPWVKSSVVPPRSEEWDMEGPDFCVPTLKEIEEGMPEELRGEDLRLPNVKRSKDDKDVLTYTNKTGEVKVEVSCTAEADFHILVSVTSPGKIATGLYHKENVFTDVKGIDWDPSYAFLWYRVWHALRVSGDIPRFPGPISD
jgi:hypothetical protein